MAELPNTGSIVAATTSRARILHAFEQLLDQCDSADLPELAKLANNKLAQRRTTYNAQHSPLVKLPAELLVELGKLVMDLATEDIHDKAWFAEVLPLMQTCKEIRTILQLLRSTSLTCEVVLRRSREIWDQVFKRLRAWVSGSCDPHEGPIRVLIHTPLPLRTQHPSTAAAMAGALECAIYGTLEVTPCVHMQCLQFYRCRPTLNRCLTYFVGHSREANVMEQSMLKDSSKIRGRRSINRTLSREEGLAIRQETIKESEARYF